MKRTNDVVVGAVILIATVLVVVATVWVSQAEVRDDREHLDARLRNVGSAQVGNPVVIRGVRAGRIEAMELADGGWVHLRMSIDPGVELPRDPVVILSASSLFGEWQAMITDRAGIPPNQDVRIAIAEASGSSDHLPGATLPDIAQLTAVAGQIAGDVASVAERVQVAFDERAATELRQSIANFAELSAELSRAVRLQSRNLDVLARDLRTGVVALGQTAQALQRTAQRVDSSTATGELSVIVDDAAVAAAQLRETTTNIRDLSRRLAGAQLQVESVLSRTDTLLLRMNSGHGSMGLFLNDPSLYQNGDSLVRELRALVGDIKANPRRYLRLEIF